MIRSISIFILMVMSFHSLAKPYMGMDLITDKSVSIESKKKDYTVAYFLSSSCPCSQAHFTHLNNLQKKYPNFNFIGFHSHKGITKKKAQEYFSQFEIKFPILLDRELDYANEFAAVKTPHVFIKDSKGEIVYQGAVTNSRNPERASKFYLKEVLADLSDDKDPQYKNVKSIGCYIQR